MITTPIKSANRLYDQIMKAVLSGRINYETVAMIDDMFTIIFGTSHKNHMLSPLLYALNHAYYEEDLDGLKLCGLCKHCNNSSCDGYNNMNDRNTPINGCWCREHDDGRECWQFDSNNALKAIISLLPSSRQHIFQMF